jgi:hypothetical protein
MLDAGSQHRIGIGIGIGIGFGIGHRTIATPGAAND